MGLPAGDSELTQILDASLAEAARRSGDWLVCHPGCTQCCHGAFAINPLDVLRLRSGMASLQAAQPALAEAIQARAGAWLAEHLPAFPGNRDTGELGRSDADRAAFEEFANDAPCPALDPTTGLCNVYEYRPITCRVFGPPVRMEAGDGSEGLAHCELCYHGATARQVAACEMPIPHELEASLLGQILDQNLDPVPTQGETVVAFALLKSSS